MLVGRVLVASVALEDERRIGVNVTRSVDNELDVTKEVKDEVVYAKAAPANKPMINCVRIVCINWKREVKSCE